MNIVTIYNDNTISVGQTMTGYYVAQESAGTVVRKSANNGLPAKGPDVLDLPKSRYSLSSESGSNEFKADFLAAYNAL